MSGFQAYLQELIKDGSMSDSEFTGLADLYIEYGKEKQAVKKQVMRSIIKKEYELGQYFKLLRGYEEKITSELKELQKKSDQKYFSFITINFDPKKTLDFAAKIENIRTFLAQLVVSYMEKALKKVWINKYMYVIEQRGIEPKFQGLHAHILLDKKVKTKRKSEIIREFYNSFKDIVSDKSKIDVRQFPAEQGKIRIDYMMGFKKEDKLAKVEADKIFRKLYDFEEQYSNDFPYFQQQHFLNSK